VEAEQPVREMRVLGCGVDVMEIALKILITIALLAIAFLVIGDVIGCKAMSNAAYFILLAIVAPVLIIYWIALLWLS